MRSLGIEDDDEIRRFTNPQYWISYFSLHIKRDLEMMGLKVNFYIISKKNIFIYNNIYRLIGVVHSLQLMLIPSMIHLFVGNFII
jgi:hypothetical protein